MALALSRQQFFWLKALIHSLAASPLLLLYYQAFNDRLGADPVEAVIHFTGIGALNLLLITLLTAPLARQANLPFFAAMPAHARALYLCLCPLSYSELSAIRVAVGYEAICTRANRALLHYCWYAGIFGS